MTPRVEMAHVRVAPEVLSEVRGDELRVASKVIGQWVSLAERSDPVLTCVLT